MRTYEVLDLCLKFAGGIGAIIAFIYGASQYQDGQNWKKAEILQGLIDSFQANPKIQAACVMLDWDAREIQVDAHTVVSFQNGKLLSALRVIWMDQDKTIPLDEVVNATLPMVASAGAFSPEEALIRDCFDAFFDYFDKVNAFQRSALVQWDDLGYFGYWFDRVQNVGREKGEPEIQKTVDLYLKVYDFKGFLKLCADYRNYCAKKTENNQSGLQ